MMFKEDMSAWLKRHVRVPKVKSEDPRSVSEQFENMFSSSFEAELAASASAADDGFGDSDGRKKRSRPSNELVEHEQKKRPTDDADVHDTGSMPLDQQGKVIIFDK
jgi:hypothetical protein